MRWMCSGTRMRAPVWIVTVRERMAMASKGFVLLQATGPRPRRRTGRRIARTRPTSVINQRRIPRVHGLLLFSQTFDAETDLIAGLEENRARFDAHPHAWGGSRRDQIPGFEGHEAADVTHQLCDPEDHRPRVAVLEAPAVDLEPQRQRLRVAHLVGGDEPGDRKSTRLNSSHHSISYAVFCLKKKKKGEVMPGQEEKQVGTSVGMFAGGA